MMNVVCFAYDERSDWCWMFFR